MKQQIQNPLCLVYHTAFVNSSTNGVKEMEGFREYFNLSRIEENTTCRANDDEKTSTLLVSYVDNVEWKSTQLTPVSQQGFVVSLFSLGSLVGGLLGGLLSDWAGRRATLVTGTLLCATGIIVQASSVFIWYSDCLTFGTLYNDILILCVLGCY